MWGFGATLGADAANAAVGEMKEVSQSVLCWSGVVERKLTRFTQWWRH